MTSKLVIAKIPEQVRYVCMPFRKVRVGSEYDYDLNDDGHKVAHEEIEVRPVFPVEEGNEKTLVTARRWANQRRSVWVPDASLPHGGKWEEPRTEEVEEVVMPNTPMKNIRVLSLEKRSQGGRAYKALIGDYYVDLREDDVVDCILHTGIDAGGVLLGEYVWIAESGLRLLRVGSEKHKAVVAYAELRSLPKIKKLDVGGVYQTKTGKIRMYFGAVNTLQLSITKNTDGSWLWSHQQRAPDIKVEEISGHLFLEMFDYKNNYKKISTQEDISFENFSYYAEILKSFEFVKKLAQIELQPDIINVMAQQIQDKCAEAETRRHSDWRAYYSKLGNMVPVPEKPVEKI